MEANNKLLHKGWFTEFDNQASGERRLHFDNAPFDQRFHLILNLAAGGGLAEDINNLGVDASVFKTGQTFTVDYVRVYECSVVPSTTKGCETVSADYKNKVEDGGTLKRDHAKY